MELLQAFRERHQKRRGMLVYGLGVWTLGAIAMFVGPAAAFVADLDPTSRSDGLRGVSLAAGFVAMTIGCALSAFVLCRPFWVPCTHCKRSAPSNTKWICGVCGQCNEQRLAWFSFLHECKACHASPTGFKCHQCGEGMFGESGDCTHWARDPADSPYELKDAWDAEEREYLRQQKRLAHQKGLAQLRRELADLKRRPVETPASEEETVEVTVKRMEQVCLKIGTLSAAMKNCRTMLDQMNLSDPEKDRVMARIRVKYLEKG